MGNDSDLITKDTYSDSSANVNKGSSFVVSHSETGVLASGILTCNNGIWEIGGGSMSFDYTGSIKTFYVPYGLKSAGKKYYFWIVEGERRR